MTRISDEKLMAYNDRELNPVEAELVRHALERDPDLQSRLMVLRDVDDQLRAAFAVEFDMPERFETALRPQSNVVRLERSRAGGSRQWIPFGAAIAAGFAGLISGTLLTAQSTPWLAQVDDGIAIEGVVQLAAERTRSGEIVRAHGLNVAPILSFAANDGRLCREIHVRGDDMAARMVACRDLDEDEWCVEAFASMPVKDFPQDYRTAAAPKDAVIDAAFARLGMKSALDAAAEHKAIAGGWKTQK